MSDRGGPKVSASSPLVQLVTPICEINGGYSRRKVSILRHQHVDAENDTCFIVQHSCIFVRVEFAFSDAKAAKKLSHRSSICIHLVTQLPSSSKAELNEPRLVLSILRPVRSSWWRSWNMQESSERRCASHMSAQTSLTPCLYLLPIFNWSHQHRNAWQWETLRHIHTGHCGLGAVAKPVLFLDWCVMISRIYRSEWQKSRPHQAQMTSMMHITVALWVFLGAEWCLDDGKIAIESGGIMNSPSLSRSFIRLPWIRPHLSGFQHGNSYSCSIGPASHENACRWHSLPAC